MKKTTIRETITRREVDAINAAGRCAYVYPRKMIVCVDGSKYYRLVG